MITRILSLVVGSVLLAFIAMLAVSSGDVKRYLRMRNMFLE